MASRPRRGKVCKSGTQPPLGIVGDDVVGGAEAEALGGAPGALGRERKAEVVSGCCARALVGGCRSRGESDHNGSAVAFTRRSSHSCNNIHRNGSPGLIGPLTISLTKCLWTLTWCLLTPRVDAGRREGAECAINILRSRMCSTFGCASLRGLRALFQTRGGVDRRSLMREEPMAHGPYGRGGTETASMGSRLLL